MKGDAVATREHERRGNTTRLENKRQTLIHQFAQVRSAAYRRATAQVTSIGGVPGIVRLGEITAEAIREWERSWKPAFANSKGAMGGWDWERLADQYRKQPDSFQLAIWAGDVLCGLAVGTVDRTAVTVRYLEGHPSGNHPLKKKVLPIVFAVATEYAKGLKRRYLRIDSPLPGTYGTLYQGLGFALEKAADGREYCELEIAP